MRFWAFSGLSLDAFQSKIGGKLLARFFNSWALFGGFFESGFVSECSVGVLAGQVCGEGGGGAVVATDEREEGDILCPHFSQISLMFLMFLSHVSLLSFTFLAHFSRIAQKKKKKKKVKKKTDEDGDDDGDAKE